MIALRKCETFNLPCGTVAHCFIAREREREFYSCNADVSI